MDVGLINFIGQNTERGGCSASDRRFAADYFC